MCELVGGEMVHVRMGEKHVADGVQGLAMALERLERVGPEVDLQHAAEAV